MRMNIKSSAIVLSFLLATLLGNGALWEYRQSQIEKQRMHLEAERRKIESMAEAIQLREKLTEVLYKLSSLVGEYHEILTAKNTGQEKIGVYPIKHKMKLLEAQVDHLLSDYEAVEANVANLEGRQPRKLNAGHFKPPPPPIMPQNIRIDGKW